MPPRTPNPKARAPNTPNGNQSPRNKPRSGGRGRPPPLSSNHSSASTAVPKDAHLPLSAIMSAEAKLAWNLKILQRHDPLITRIMDQTPFTSMYEFQHSNPGNPRGKKYEGEWTKSGVEGVLFIIQRSEAPHYGFFLLNRKGSSSVVQMFHKDDFFEVGADPKFLTIRPGYYGYANTPYDVPVTTPEKPTTLCLWISEEAAGPRFVRFMKRVKERLARDDQPHESNGSPPLTPLSQYRDNGSESESTDGSFEDDLSSETHAEARDEGSEPGPHGIARPLDQLFASLLPPPAPHPATNPNLATNIQTRTETTTTYNTTATVSTKSVTGPSNLLPPIDLFSVTTNESTSHDPDEARRTLDSLFKPIAQPNGNHNTTQTPAPAAPQMSLLDQIFASAAPKPRETTPVAESAASGATNPAAEENAISLTNILPLLALGSDSRQETPTQRPSNARSARPPKTPPLRPVSVESSNSDVDDDDDVVLLIDGQSYQNGRGLPFPTTPPMEKAAPASFSASHLQDDVAPSPSLLPNPVHTPKAKTSRRQRMRAKRLQESSRDQGTFAPSLDDPSGSGVATALAVREKAKGSSKDRVREQYIPHTVEPESKLVGEDVARAVVEAYGTLPQKAEGAVLSKYEFVSELLTLIHKDPEFVKDLYAKYEDSVQQH